MYYDMLLGHIGLYDEGKQLHSSLADAEYRSDWDEAIIRCFTIEDMSYDNFKLAVESEFGVCTDYNVPLMDYFAVVGSEVGA